MTFPPFAPPTDPAASLATVKVGLEPFNKRLLSLEEREEGLHPRSDTDLTELRLQSVLKAPGKMLLSGFEMISRRYLGLYQCPSFIFKPNMVAFLTILPSSRLPPTSHPSFLPTLTKGTHPIFRSMGNNPDSHLWLCYGLSMRDSPQDWLLVLATMEVVGYF